MSQLLEAALAARARAYAPYSNFQVGAAILSDDGTVYSGCNVENAAYPLGQCAEANAIADMIRAGCRTIREIVIVGDSEAPCTPCGGCRQRLAEFAPVDTPVTIYRLRQKQLETRLADLLPHAFGPSHLDNISQPRPQNTDQELDRVIDTLKPKIAVILGSGLGSFVHSLELSATFPYADLDGFPTPTVHGHQGRLVLGRLNNTPIVVLQGRVHLYEGHIASAVHAMIRRIARLGCQVLIVTNAAGAIRTDLRPGEMALIEDHINAMGTSPLVGPNDDKIGPRFPDMSEAYHPALSNLARQIAERLGIELPSSVYLATLGPAFETPSEITAFRAIGADLVGMSTVPEVISARHLGLDVVGFSVVTNHASGISSTKLSHQETLRYAAQASGKVSRLFNEFIPAVEDWLGSR